MKKKRTLFHWLSNLFLVLLLLIGLALIFNNQIKNFLIKHNGDAYAVSEISRADVKKIWRQTLLLILMPLNRPAQKQFLKRN